MKIRETVFNSYSEHLLYKALKTRWGEAFNLFPSLPFLNIIDIEGGEITEAERQLLSELTVGFTLCEKESDKPLLSIEFDVFGHGFSRFNEYIQILPANDPNWKQKLDLKLRIANEVIYPFFVVSYDESYPFDPELDLTIVDGIIGRVLANKYFGKVLSEIEISEEDIEKQIKILSAIYPPGTRDRREYIADIITDIEVEAELLWDPIVKKAAELEGELFSKGIIKSWEIRYHEEPPAPLDLEALLELYKNKTVCIYGIDTCYGKIEKKVVIRNIEGFGVRSSTIAENIARLLAAKEVYKKFKESSEGG